MPNLAKRLIETIESLYGKTPELDEVYIAYSSRVERLDEARKWVKGSSERSIGIDTAHAGGQVHAHVFGRKGNEIVVVNIDGTGSHGTKGRLSPADAEALSSRGFKIRPDRLVEWFAVSASLISL